MFLTIGESPGEHVAPTALADMSIPLGRQQPAPRQPQHGQPTQRQRLELPRFCGHVITGRRRSGYLLSAGFGTWTCGQLAEPAHLPAPPATMSASCGHLDDARCPAFERHWRTVAQRGMAPMRVIKALDGVKQRRARLGLVRKVCRAI
jgi:hypothetical protein